MILVALAVQVFAVPTRGECSLCAQTIARQLGDLLGIALVLATEADVALGTMLRVASVISALTAC